MKESTRLLRQYEKEAKAHNDRCPCPSDSSNFQDWPHFMPFYQWVKKQKHIDQSVRDEAMAKEAPHVMGIEREEAYERALNLDVLDGVKIVRGPFVPNVDLVRKLVAFATQWGGRAEPTQRCCQGVTCDACRLKVVYDRLNSATDHERMESSCWCANGCNWYPCAVLAGCDGADTRCRPGHVYCGCDSFPMFRVAYITVTDPNPCSREG